jgi:hypothetical protein
MSRSKKKKNTEESTVQATANKVIETGVSHLLVLGLHDNGRIEIGETFGNFEQIHTILNRATFEVNKAHAQMILNLLEKEQEQEEVAVENT